MLVNLDVDDFTLEIVDRAYNVLANCDRCSSSVHQSHPTRVLTGKRDRPSFNIRKRQVNYLLEQGFKVAEISSMLGVSKRTLERRMNALGLSVSGESAGALICKHLMI